jgi:hypothetical protein
MNRITAGAIALVLGIPLAGCQYVRCETPNVMCSDLHYNRVYVDSSGQILQEYSYKHDRAPGQYPVVPGQYLVTLAADAEVKPITDLYGQFGIQEIRTLGIVTRGRYRLFALRLSEDPGPARILELGRENTQVFSVTPSFGNLHPSQTVDFRPPPKSD